jgi:predicted PurR-regulated permease PerM
MDDAKPDSTEQRAAESGSRTGADGAGDRGLDLRTAHLWHLQPVRDLLVIAVVVLTVYAGYAMRTVTVPLLVAIALAYLVEPLVSRMSQWRRMNRPLAVGAILAVLGAVLSVAVAIVVPLAVGQTLSFAENLRNHRYDGAIARVVEAVPEAYRDDVQNWVNRVVAPQPAEPGAEAPATGRTEDETQREATSPPGESPTQPVAPSAEPEQSAAAGPKLFERLPESVRTVGLDNPFLSLLGAGSRQVYGFALAVLQLGLVAFLIPFYFYYFSVHWPSITGFFAKLVPDERKGAVFEIVSDMDKAVAGFVRGRIVICALMGVMFAVGWQICGVPYGIALGLMTGAFSIVPYLGGIGVPLAVGLLVVDQFGMPPDERMAVWGMLLWPILVFVVVQTIEGYLLTPVIAGKATNLDPVTIVVAILAGGSVAGVYGMLLAIPLAACGKIAVKRIVLPRLIEFARGRAADPLPIEGALDEQPRAELDALPGMELRDGKQGRNDPRNDSKADRKNGRKKGQR